MCISKACVKQVYNPRLMYCRSLSCIGLSKIISTRAGILEGNLWRIPEESGDVHSRSRYWIVSGLLHLSHTVASISV